MNFNLFAGKENGRYYAKARYKNGQVTVLKGSIISNNVSHKIQPVVLKIRNNKELVEGNILLQDIVFRSPSTAASFVTGNISNGNRVWKNKNKVFLKELLEEKNG